MKKCVLIAFLAMMSYISFAQDATTILNFEEPGLSTNFQYFGSTLDGSLTEVIANPNPTGVNTSDSVVLFIKPANAEVWAGGWSNPDPTVPVDLIGAAEVCVDVHMDHIGNLALKLENSTTGGGNWIQTQANTTVNEWETLCFDISLDSEEDPIAPAIGHIYTRVVLFFDFGMMGGATDSTYYVDNIVVNPAIEVTTILNFEESGLTTDFQYFGSTLDGSKTEVISNPNPSGINTSDSVVLFIKPANAEVWAGGWSNPDPAVPVDLIGATEVCVDVHMDHIGNLALKLENSTTGGGNWIQTQANTVTDEWEKLCFDISLDSEEDPIAPAVGHIYTRVVLFFDFGMMGGATDSTYYVDNIEVFGSGATPMSDVTFAVDMAEYSGSFTTVYVSGTFNNWAGDANALADADADGVWTGTINLPQGSHEYKFSVDNWADSEQLNPGDECTVTKDGFTNRELSFSADVALDTVCWASCYACGDQVSVTWNVSMNSQDSVSTDGVYVAGGSYFGHGDFPMSDPDGDGIWTLKINQQIGFESDYTFLNGLCPTNWACKEDIAGQNCAVPPWNDRHVGPVTADTVINTCFGECSPTTDCGGGPTKYDVTFQVDMSNETIAGDIILAGGSFNPAWCGDCFVMDDSDGDMIYSITMEMLPGNHEYKFLNGPGGWENFPSVDSCTIESGGFINRYLELPPMDMVLDPVYFGTCVISSSAIAEKQEVNDLISIRPTINRGAFTVSFGDYVGEIDLSIIQVDGRLVENWKEQNAGTDHYYEFNLNSGLYFVLAQTSDWYQVQKIVIE